MAQYPLINGTRYDFSSIEIVAGNRTITGAKAISYKNGLKPGVVRGTSAQKNGRTRGQYEPEASLTLYKQEADELIEALGTGYMEKPFDIVIHYADDGQPTKTTRIIGARIADESDDHEEGSDALATKFDLDVIAVIKNGVSPLRNLNV